MTVREPTLRERMAADRARLFVGRGAELGALDALLAPDPGPAIAWVYGPGGIGKTELLGAFRRRCDELGRSTAWISGADIPANPIAFRDAFDEARDAGVILVDGAEHLAAIVPWLCASFLPDLPVSKRLVLAGRDRPPAALTVDPAWLRIVRVLEIEGFAPEDCADYLRRRDVPVDQHAAIARASFRHPLAVALLAEVLAQSRGRAPDLSEHPDLVRGLLAQLLREVPSPRHQLALWSLAVVRHLTRPLIRALVDPGADDVYDWLRERSFVRMEPEGLVPHDLVREILLADLSWTDPVLDRRLAARAVDVLVDSFDTAGADASHVLSEIYFAAGGRSLILAEGSRGEYAAEPLRREDWPAVEAMAARFEGPTVGRLVRFWLERGGDAYGIRDLDDRLAGFGLFLWLHEIARGDAAQDPMVSRIHDRLDEGAGPPRTCILRTWMDVARDRELGPTQVAVNKLSGELVWRRRPDVLVGCERPLERFLEVAPPGMYEIWPFDVEVDGLHYGLFSVDYRRDPLVPWFKRYMRTMMQTAQIAPPVPREVFEPAVREALRALHRPDGLLGSPLLESRLVRAARPGTPLQAAGALGDLLRKQSRMFLGSERDAVHYRVLEATYFEPHAKQLQAAATLGMPYGTYRRTLSVAVRRLTEALWQREVA